MASGVTVEVHGFRELSRDFAKMGKETKKELRDALKPAGELVRDQAKVDALGQGLRDTGTPIRRIAVRVNARGVEVVAAATGKNDATKFNYPRRYEFTGRPFLAPALEQRGQAAAELVFDAFDALAKRYGF